GGAPRCAERPGLPAAAGPQVLPHRAGDGRDRRHRSARIHHRPALPVRPAAADGMVGGVTVTASVISAEQVSHYFRRRDGEPLHVLDRVSVDVAEGSFVSLVGASGCGKSTLLKMLAGLVTPTSGQV